MRIHLLAIPNTQTRRACYLDGFCLRTILFSRLLKRLGHEVILYGVGDGTDAPCDHFVRVMTVEEQQAFVGDTPYQNVSWEHNTALAVAWNAKASNHIRSVKVPADVICTIAGSGQQQIAEAHPELLFVEYSVGYTGVASRAHRVYQSEAWRHIVYGFTGVQGGRLYDAVIPPWFLVEEFPYVERPEPYVVYCGRLVHSKGIHTVCESARLAGVKLILIGHGAKELVTYGEFLGEVSDVERNKLLANATACLMPTQYVEPFGNVCAEAQLCGTPMITSDFGAFPESVEQGKTGYRCNSLGEYVQAISLVRQLDRDYIRARAVSLWSEETAMGSYRRYVDRLKTLQGEGWRHLAPTLEGPYGSQQLYSRSNRPTESPLGESAVGHERAEPVCCETAA